MAAIYAHLFIAAAADAELPWHPSWLRACCIAESGMNEWAVSPAGACGLAQFMPRTWDEECQRLGLGSRSPFCPRDAILVQAHYLQKLRGVWSFERPEHERIKLVFASYNAGYGNILEAQRRAGGAMTWAGIKLKLELVTGPENAHQTNTYVDRVVETALRLGVDDYPRGHR